VFSPPSLFPDYVPYWSDSYVDNPYQAFNPVMYSPVNLHAGYAPVDEHAVHAPVNKAVGTPVWSGMVPVQVTELQTPLLDETVEIMAPVAVEQAPVALEQAPVALGQAPVAYEQAPVDETLEKSATTTQIPPVNVQEINLDSEVRQLSHEGDFLVCTDQRYQISNFFLNMKR
jgi:hypothetical protein